MSALRILDVGARRFTLLAVLVAAALASTGVVRAGNLSVPVTAFWDFDDLNNPLKDQTGNGNDLISPGGGSQPTLVLPSTASGNGWTPNGLAGTAMDFDGGDWLDLPGGIYSGSDFTFITAQHRAAAVGGYRTMLASSRFRYQNINDQLGGGINAPGGNFGGSTPLSADDWHFIALRYTHATRSLESWKVTNSALLGAPAITGTATAPGLNNAINFRYGGDGVSFIGGPDRWDGELDFAVFHDGALSNAQIQTILTEFNNSPNVLPPPQPLPPPTAKWDFNDANPLLDRTGNGHNLINPGGANSPTFGPATPGANGWRTNEGDSGNVAVFDGNDYLAMPNSVYAGGNFTVIVAHLRPTAAGGYDTILSSSRFRFQNINDALGGAINSPGGTFGGTSPLNPDDWYFTALRYNDYTRALESFAVTGTDVLGGPVLFGSANAPGLGNATNWWIGGNNSGIGGPDAWQGELDLVLFYNQFLTDQQIQTLLSQFVIPEPATLSLLAIGLAVAHRRRRRRKA